MLNIPESTDAKSAFGRFTAIAVEQTIRGRELLADTLVCPRHPLGVGMFKAVPGQAEKRGVHVFATKSADITVQVFIPGFGFDFLANAVSGAGKQITRDSLQ